LNEPLIEDAKRELAARRKENGGFAQVAPGPARPDATAWAVLALRRGGPAPADLDAACRFLAGFQLPDGRVVFARDAAPAWWPTPLAALAWGALPGFRKEKELATGFLLQTSGRHFKKEKGSPTGHDTTIRGWSWVEETHSWVEPTALAILALRAAGKGGHPRVAEAAAMLMDRRLPGGGWNYGNTTVFGQKLFPMPDATGLALAALAGMADRPSVGKSLEWAEMRAREIDAPFSLCWLSFGLSAWGVAVPDLGGRILRCLSLQERRGAYGTTLLALLLLAHEGGGDLHSLLGVR